MRSNGLGYVHGGMFTFVGYTHWIVYTHWLHSLVTLTGYSLATLIGYTHWLDNDVWTHFEDPGSERNVIRLQIVSSNTLVAGYAQEVTRVQEMSNTATSDHTSLISK